MSNRVYEIVTERICELLDSGTVPWHQPWNAELGMPRSLSTGKLYRGVNIWLLGSSMYESPWWGTYRNITERGGQVRKGEKSTLVVFWKRTEYKATDDNGEESDRSGFLLRYYRVFNATQCEGLELPGVPGAQAREHEAIEEAQFIVNGYLNRPGSPPISYGGERAAYSPQLDHLYMPQPETFENAEGFYSTIYHEMTHSTGHENRLARKELLEFHSFGDPSYSREELVAEMGASMLSGLSGIDQITLPQSAAYLSHWVKVLKGDVKLVVQAAAQAQHAADWIMAIEHEQAVAA